MNSHSAPYHPVRPALHWLRLWANVTGTLRTKRLDSQGKEHAQ